MLIAHVDHISDEKESLPMEMENEADEKEGTTDAESGEHLTETKTHIETVEDSDAPISNNMGLMNYGLGEVVFVLLLISPFLLSILKQKMFRKV
ncbi:hypothetical protein [[Limnothrix rosea] IAM M-220]|uniref:hypothetical protein n=1 Tax=[Limnothrix rosea] IAM M-220 TaxID=454133 RepID=UPI000961B66A|nr:hypothetical protein [[Limnothrix rosea] IAM M-220]OKH17682.1 hypothetical protein NIES208_08490 [[Limnothrix rosea] IAM M-220]